MIPILQTIAQVGTLVFLIWYAIETYRIRKNAAKQTDAIIAQFEIMQKTLQREIMSDEAADEPKLVWVKDWQRVGGFMWKIKNVGGGVRFLEARSSHGKIQVVSQFLDTGESCSVTQASSERPHPQDADIEYYGLKYQSKHGRQSERVYRYLRQSKVLEETADIRYSTIENVGTVG